jgi:hypothetical protein
MIKRIKPLEPQAQVTFWHCLTRVVTLTKMAGVAGLEPVTSAVTGQRSNQLSYTPAKGNVTIENVSGMVKRLVGRQFRKIRAADAKEVGVGNPAEETYCYPNGTNVTPRQLFVNILSAGWGPYLAFCRGRNV